MAKRCLESITIDGTERALMQINDFSIFNTVGWGERVYRANSAPSFVTSAGYDFGNLFDRTWISDDTSYTKNIQGSFAKIKKYMYSSGSYNAINLWMSDNTEVINGYDQASNYITTYLAIVLDDDLQEGYIALYGARSSGSYTKFVWVYDSGTTQLSEIYRAFAESTYTSNGGGATHIAKRTGQLKDLSSNLPDILMVSGGGGGGLLVGETEYTGKEAGGISGNGDNSADQSTGNAFGQGESGTNVSGGGSGLYGGYKGTSAKSGGAGSGYIGNSLLSNKKMVGYNVPTSSAESTKTESVSQASATPTPNVPKIGNGFARIKLKSLS